MKLLIADDDRQIVDGIKEGIDWKSLGIHEVLPAYNGLEALELFVARRPEIVITDVRMPGMDGLALLKRIKEIQPSVKAVILSGYADFEYMKKAIQFGTVDYELKPVKVRSLINLIRKMKDDIVRERVSEENYNKYLASHKEKFVSELLEGKVSDRNIILEGLKQYFDFDGRGAIVCAVLETDYYRTWAPSKPAPEQEKPFAFLRENIRTEILENEDVLLLKTGENAMTALIRTVDSGMYVNNLRTGLKRHIAGLSASLRSELGLTLSAGISSMGTAADISLLYEQAKTALKYKLYTGSSSVNFYELSSCSDKNYYAVQIREEEMMKEIQALDLESVYAAIGREFDGIAGEHNCSRAGVSSFCHSLLSILVKACKDGPEDAAGDAVRKLEGLEDNPSLETLEDFRRYVLESYKEVLEAYAGSRKGKPGSGMQKALEYIRKNYNKELTVEAMAEYVGKTPNYFSHLFKKEVGVSFTEYVNKIRITKARELILNSNLLLYEIGEQVGYRDYAYFTQMFKRIEGCPPAELRRGGV